MEATRLRKRAAFIITAALAALLAAVALAAWPKSAPRASGTIVAGSLERGIYPLEIMRNTDIGKLPIERFRDGECPDRC
jgi:hypothetical protein